MEGLRDPIPGNQHIPVIAFDLDGTLTIDESKPMIYREVRKNIVDLMGRYKKLGYVVIIYTSRDISRKAETLLWLNNMVPDACYDDIVFNKLKYDLMIDDKVINVNSLTEKVGDGTCLAFDPLSGLDRPYIWGCDSVDDEDKEGEIIQ